MADPRPVSGSPPPVLRRTFEVVARLLRSMGRGRYLVADAAGSIAYALQPAAKRRLCAHLHSRAAGGLGGAEARRRARASYRSYARMVVDSIWVHAIDLDRMSDHGWVDGVEHFDNARDAGRGGILVLVHFGSWDMAASLALAAGHEISTVMAPVGPPAITELLAWSRMAKRMELFAPAAAARGLLRALRRGRLVALLVDIPEGGPTAVVPFCNGPVRFSTGPAALARITGAPIICCDCWRTPAGYVLRAHEPFTPPTTDGEQAVMAHLATILEAQVKAIPDQWYPFNQIYQDET